MMTGNVKIIAEIGVNHNGDMGLAKDTIMAAKNSGATCVKFQLFSASKLASKQSHRSAYQVKNTGEGGSQIEMLQQLELSVNDMITLRDFCKDHCLEFLLSAFDDESLKALKSPLEMSLIKIPSGEITNIPMLIEIGSTFNEIILSTGMSTMADVELAIAALSYGRAQKNADTFTSSADAIAKIMAAYYDDAIRNDMLSNLTLLQCTSEYPAPVEDVHLNVMKSMAHAFGCNVGFSDHTLGSHIAVAAVVMGAKVIEKHFTIDKTLPGPDHLASSSPEEFQEMVQQIADIERALGNGIKTVSPSEEGTVNVARKFVTASQNIKEGDTFSTDNICVKRGNGKLPPISLYDIYGDIAKKEYETDDGVQ